MKIMFPTLKSIIRMPIGPFFACYKCRGGRTICVSHFRKNKNPKPVCVKCGEKQQDPYYICYKCVARNKESKVTEKYHHKPKDLYYIKTYNKFSCAGCVGQIDVPAWNDLQANKLPTLEDYFKTFQINKYNQPML